MIEDTKRETIVFAYDTDEQRRALFDMFSGWFERDDGLRIIAMSVDNEVSRTSRISEALERYDGLYDLRDAIQAIIDHPNMTRFKWSDIDETEAA